MPDGTRPTFLASVSSERPLTPRAAMSWRAARAIWSRRTSVVSLRALIGPGRRREVIVNSHSHLSSTTSFMARGVLQSGAAQPVRELVARCALEEIGSVLQSAPLEPEALQEPYRRRIAGVDLGRDPLDAMVPEQRLDDARARL